MVGMGSGSIRTGLSLVRFRMIMVAITERIASALIDTSLCLQVNLKNRGMTITRRKRKRAKAAKFHHQT